MKRNGIYASILAAALLVACAVAPIAANAQGSLDQASKHRQKTKNDWRNLSYGSGAATAYGLLKHDKTVTILGAAGTLYSLNRYEHDRKSQSKIDHDRASYYGRSSYRQNGHRYVRKLVTRNGRRYYTFVRA